MFVKTGIKRKNMRIEHSSWAKDKNNPPFNIIIHHKFSWSQDNVVAVSHIVVLLYL